MIDPLTPLRYLTVLPLPRGGGAGDLGRAAGWFPVVGLLIGGFLALGGLAADLVTPPAVSAVLVVLLWAGLTGGLHLDGLADACDGLGASADRERALRIMRDTRIGAYGATALVLVLALKLAALASLPDDLFWRSLLVAPVLGRLAPVWLARLCPPARSDGAGRGFALGAGTPGLVVATLVGAGASVALLGAWGVLLAVGTPAGAWAAAAYLRRRLGGLTGDCLGALVEVTEAGTLTVVSALAYLEAL